MKTVSHETADGRTVSVVVREGTLRDKLKRASMIQGLTKEGQREGEEWSGIVADIVMLDMYPSCIASSAEYKDSQYPGRTVESMSFDEFMDIPGQLLEKWAEAVFELNPDWKVANLVPQLMPLSEDKLKQNSTND